MMYFIFAKKQLLILVAAVIGLFTGAALLISAHAGGFFSDSHLTVIVDAGHGLPDGGAIGAGGSIEQEINLRIAQKLEEVLCGKGIRVIMTRTDEYGIWRESDRTIREKKVSDMQSRLAIMNKTPANLFISLHMNSHSDPKASGLRIFYSQKFEEIKPLAEYIQLRMSDVTGANVSTVKTADSKLFLMKNPPIPAILVECGFISNPLEEKKLTDEDYQARLAWAIADAVEKYYITN